MPPRAAPANTSASRSCLRLPLLAALAATCRADLHGSGAASEKGTVLGAAEFDLPFWLRGAGDKPGWGGKFRRAHQILYQAFAGEKANLELAMVGLALLKEMASFCQTVQDHNWGSVFVLEETGEVVELSEDEMRAIQAFMDEHTFTLIDILTLMQLESWALAGYLAEDERNPRMLFRIIRELRGPFWEVLSLREIFVWSVPFFGALAHIARELRAFENFPADAYRELLWNQTDETNLSASAITRHLNVLGEGWITSEYDRSAGFRLACAHLSVDFGKSAVENAERHIKAFPDASMRALLQHAAEWPVFDLLKRMALRVDRLLEPEPPNPRTPTPMPTPLSAVSSGQDLTPSGSPEAARAAGVQWLPPGTVLEMYRMLHVVAGLCDAFGVDWWVSHGTLIGALRDGGLFSHADDCEIDIFGGPNAEVFHSLHMRRALARNGYELGFDPRGGAFKVWPAGSPQASPETDDQLENQNYWLPQRRVGLPSLDVYLLEFTTRNGELVYLSNEEFHCNMVRCVQRWQASELSSFRSVPFGLSKVRVPIGAESYLDRAYGPDWNLTVRPHRWAAEQHFEARDARHLERRVAEPFGPLLEPVLPTPLPRPQREAILIGEAGEGKLGGYRPRFP